MIRTASINNPGKIVETITRSKYKDIVRSYFVTRNINPKDFLKGHVLVDITDELLRTGIDISQAELSRIIVDIKNEIDFEDFVRKT